MGPRQGWTMMAMVLVAVWVRTSEASVSCGKPGGGLFVNALDPTLKVQGRAWADAGESALSFDWSGVAVSFLVTNTSGVAVVFADSGTANWYKVLVNSQEVVDVAAAGCDSLTTLQVPFSFDPLTSYEVEFFKRTEPANNYVPTVFYGVSLDPQASLKGPAPASRSILFFGDSVTAGYADLGNATSNCSLSMSALEDNWYDYSSVLARQFNGVVRNYGDPSPISTCPNCPMPYYFNKTIATSEDAGVPYAFSEFVPDAIVCNLGTNDYSTEPAPSQQQFTQGYLALITQFRAAYPQSVVFLVCGPILGQPCSYVQQVVQATSNAVYIDMQGLLTDEVTCCGHPNAAAQAIMAKTAAPIIANRMGWLD